MPEEIEAKVQVDTSGVDKALEELQKKSDLFGRTLSNAFRTAAISGQSLDDVLKQLAMNIASMALSTGLKPLQDQISGLFSSFIGSLKREPGAFYGTPPIPPDRPTFFAKGGVVNNPTYFNAGGSLGLMGEAGTEAVLPLTRGADGRLGVAAQGGGSPVHVTFNVTTSDATSFRKSEAQVSAARPTVRFAS